MINKCKQQLLNIKNIVESVKHQLKFLEKKVNKLKFSLMADTILLDYLMTDQEFEVNPYYFYFSFSNSCYSL